MTHSQNYSRTKTFKSQIRNTLKDNDLGFYLKLTITHQDTDTSVYYNKQNSQFHKIWGEINGSVLFITYLGGLTTEAAVGVSTSADFKPFTSMTVTKLLASLAVGVV